MPATSLCGVAGLCGWHLLVPVSVRRLFGGRWHLTKFFFPLSPTVLSPHMCACVGWCALPEGLVSPCLPLSPHCLPTCVPVLDGVSAFPRVLSPLVSPCLPLSPTVSHYLPTYVPVYWMVCPPSRGSCLPLSPLVSHCLPICVPGLSAFPGSCLLVPQCLLPLSSPSVFSHCLLPLSPHMCACVGWCVHLPEGLVSPCLRLSPIVSGCLPTCVPALDGVSAFPRVLSPLMSPCLPLSPLVSGRSRAGEVRHYGRQHPWVRGHTQGPSSVFAALGTNPLQRIPWLVWLEMLLRWLCLPLSPLVSHCLPLSPTRVSGTYGEMFTIPLVFHVLAYVPQCTSSMHLLFGVYGGVIWRFLQIPAFCLLASKIRISNSSPFTRVPSQPVALCFPISYFLNLNAVLTAGDSSRPSPDGSSDGPKAFANGFRLVWVSPSYRLHAA